MFSVATGDIRDLSATEIQNRRLALQYCSNHSRCNFYNSSVTISIHSSLAGSGLSSCRPHGPAPSASRIETTIKTAFRYYRRLKTITTTEGAFKYVLRMCPSYYSCLVPVCLPARCNRQILPSPAGYNPKEIVYKTRFGGTRNPLFRSWEAAAYRFVRTYYNRLDIIRRVIPP